MDFTILPIENPVLEEKIQHKINTKTKPLGALGVLEKIALQIGLIQDTENPILRNPTMLVFAGDHGIAKKGEVNLFPQEVTSQMVYNFLQGGAAINVFCNLNNIHLRVVDAGVNHDFKNAPGLENAKIGFGTKNYENEAAMTKEECALSIEKGASMVAQQYEKKCNSIGFGEMGIGNTSAASLLMAYFTTIPIYDCVGAGTGLSTENIIKKQKILSAVFLKHTPKTAMEALATFGGFEIAMITGAILKAAELKMMIIIDGFIVTTALLVAHAIDKNVLDYCIFSHTSGEQGHEKIIKFLDKAPVLDLGLRLGEGTGSAIAYPILKAAVAFLNEMASFEDAGVSNT